MSVQANPPDHVLARTLWGEARGEGYVGMLAVAMVVRNRVQSGIAWWGTDIDAVCLHPFQFSCWNADDPNLPKLLAVTDFADADFADAVMIERHLPEGQFDFTNGATHYFDWRTKAPAWAIGATLLAKIGHHAFYKVT